eukprot:COSAG01_NODE_7171_length_3319_cov_7.886957_2_plen_121_part_00
MARNCGHLRRLRQLCDHTAFAAAEGAPSSPPDGAGAGGIRVEKLPQFGVRLHNVRLAHMESMSDAQWHSIQSAFDEHGVIVMGGQGEHLPPGALTELARRLHRASLSDAVLCTQAVALWP